MKDHREHRGVVYDERDRIVVYDSRVLTVVRDDKTPGGPVWLLTAFSREPAVALSAAQLSELTAALFGQMTGDDYQLWKRVRQ